MIILIPGAEANWPLGGTISQCCDDNWSQLLDADTFLISDIVYLYISVGIAVSPACYFGPLIFKFIVMEQQLH